MKEKSEKSSIITIKLKKRGKEGISQRQMLKLCFEMSKRHSAITKEELIYQAEGLGYDKPFKELLMAAFIKVSLEELINEGRLEEYVKIQTEKKPRRKKTRRKRKEAI